MAHHRDLTGAELHEPKGIATAASGQVYVANGSGSGTWVNKNDGDLTYNQYFLQDQMVDISSVTSAFFYIPVKSELTRLSAVLHGATSGTDKILSVYINGVLFADSMTVLTAGSTAGVATSRAISTANTIPAGAVVEVRSNGASASVAKATIQLGLRAKV